MKNWTPDSRPGWYRNESGRKSWWDGSTWHERKPKQPFRWGVFALYGSAVAICAIGVIAWSIWGPQEGVTARITPVESDSSSSQSTSIKSSAELLDEAMNSDGWNIGSSGDLYWRWFSESEEAESSCGSYACSFVAITSANGCASGVYVRADIMKSGSPVGWTNEISATIQPNETASVVLEDIRGIGDQFRVTEVTCMG